jgi:hypothetical protein
MVVLSTPCVSPASKMPPPDKRRGGLACHLLLFVCEPGLYQRLAAKRGPGPREQEQDAPRANSRGGAAGEEPMRVDIQTNTTPIRAGDEVMIDFHPIWTDVGTLYYSVHLPFDGGRSFPRTIASNVSVFAGRTPWTVDVIGNGLLVQGRT